MDKTLIERLDRAFDDSNYFFEVLQVLFYKDNKWSRRVTELDRDMFRDFCNHVQTTYQNLFIGTDDPRAYMQFVTPYIVLFKIALFPEYIDSKHDQLQGFAELVCSSISHIISPASTENRLIIDDPFFNAYGEWAVLYDFEKDTPEDVWDRVSGYFVV